MNMTQIRKQFADLKLNVNFAGYVNGNRTYRIAYKESGSSAAPFVFTKSDLVEYLEA